MRFNIKKYYTKTNRFLKTRVLYHPVSNKKVIMPMIQRNLQSPLMNCVFLEKKENIY